MDELRLGGAEAEAFGADMREPLAIEAMFAAVQARFGRLDGLVNSAGIGLPKARVKMMTQASRMPLKLKTATLMIMLLVLVYMVRRQHWRLTKQEIRI